MGARRTPLARATLSYYLTYVEASYGLRRSWTLSEFLDNSGALSRVLPIPSANGGNRLTI